MKCPEVILRGAVPCIRPILIFIRFWNEAENCSKALPGKARLLLRDTKKHSDLHDKKRHQPFDKSVVRFGGFSGLPGLFKKRKSSETMGQ
jgi:hypothetical protein